MEKTITLEMTESQAKKFEELLDEFNDAMKRVKEKEPTREEEMSKLETETRLLLSQAREELRRIKELNSNRKKVIWEQ
jgi:ppGpp synthetase/RelA/SpoT-type nucleotidyltranferase